MTFYCNLLCCFVLSVYLQIVFASCATQCFQPEERPNTARMRLIEHDVFSVFEMVWEIVFC